jgi:serine/threonine-protein kinase
MSPEQLLGGEQIDGRSDLWSLGVVTYEALTGRRPFQGATGAQITLGITSGRFSPPRMHSPGLPRALDAWFVRALSPRLASRFGSAEEMIDAFDAAVRPALR